MAARCGSIVVGGSRESGRDFFSHDVGRMSEALRCFLEGAGTACLSPGMQLPFGWRESCSRNDITSWLGAERSNLSIMNMIREGAPDVRGA